MTLNDYAHEIIEIVQKQLVDDSEIDVRLVEDLIRDQRELDIYKTISSYKGMAPYSEVSGYSQFVKYSFSYEANTDTSTSLGSNNAWLISDTDIFSVFIESSNTPMMFFVVKADSGGDISPSGIYNKIDIVPADRATYVGNGRYNSSQKVAFYVNGKLAITSRDTSYLETNDGEDFYINGILKDPTSAEGFSEETDTYPMGPRWAYIQDYVIKKLITKLSSPEDVLNDSSDRVIQSK